MIPQNLVPDSFPFEIHLYGIMIAVGLLAAFLILFAYSKKLGINEKLTDFIFYDGIVGVATGFGAAALFQATYNYISHPERGFDIQSGITFIGGLIGGTVVFLAAYFILKKKLKINLSDALSIIPCCITLGHGFGRIGCFFAGCCYGMETDSFLGVHFPSMAEGVKVHPTQLYEAAFLFLLFAVMSFLLLKFKFRHNLSLYLMAYGVFRFLIEFVRDDERGSFLGALSPSQFWSLVMIAIGAGLLLLSIFKFKGLGKLPDNKPATTSFEITEDTDEGNEQ